MAIGALTQVVFECADPAASADFWQKFLDLNAATGDPDWLTLLWPGVGRFSFHQVDGYVAPTWPGENGELQVHFDFLVEDLESATDQALTYGARPLTDILNPDTKPWRIFSDPAGHPFCLVTTPE